MINKQKQIIERLNKMFTNYEQLQIFCNKLSNNTDKIIENINKIIKYAFVNESFINNKKPLNILLYDIKDVDTLYKEYLNKRSILNIFKKKESKITFDIPLESDIRLSDLEGLRLPTLEKIKEICDYNKYKDQEKKKQQIKKDNYYQKHRIFEETAFTYIRTELITINPSLIYYHQDLSGNIYEDYNFLYQNKEKYKNILNNSYETNVAKIKKSSDILLKKTGNVYEIENGRHRIIYLPIQIKRRIEDKEFNIVLNNLKKEYNISIIKNNLLNNEPNILIILNNKAYEIKNKEELIKFYNNLKQGLQVDRSINILPFDINNLIEIDTNKIINQYRDLIFNKYLEIGESILNSNFTEIIKQFNSINNCLFYQAFISIQQNFQESLIYKNDFKESYKKQKEYIKFIDNIDSIENIKTPQAK